VLYPVQSASLWISLCTTKTAAANRDGLRVFTVWAVEPAAPAAISMACGLCSPGVNPQVVSRDFNWLADFVRRAEPANSSWQSYQLLAGFPHPKLPILRLMPTHRHACGDRIERRARRDQRGSRRLSFPAAMANLKDGQRADRSANLPTLAVSQPDAARMLGGWCAIRQLQIAYRQVWFTATHAPTCASTSRSADAVSG
jgi:hypothetical protein